ncbi:hypothetical protein Fmac_021397 [Flemingia macrophylla]|uniref:Uncharacterized protein n=1 Tax=Flemingia macrophylla TaxID=520843 RepID=A0ABD1LWS7_9FABA
MTPSSLVGCSIVSIPLYLDDDRVTEDYLWLFYMKRKSWNNAGSKFGIYVDISYGLTGSAEVKRYGYGWVYEKDLQISNTKL